MEAASSKHKDDGSKRRRTTKADKPPGAGARAGVVTHGDGAGAVPPRPQRRRTAQGRFAPAVVRIGVLSDTHGYLDPEILTVFAGVDHIIHAGDVMDPAILAALARVAPVTAVSGNLDDGELIAALPREAVGEVHGVRFVVGHKPRRLLKRLASGKFVQDGHRPDLVIWGHLHTPTAEWVDGELHLNPGTATSPDDEDDGPTVAVVELRKHGLAVQFVPLERRSPDELAGLVRQRRSS